MVFFNFFFSYLLFTCSFCKKWWLTAWTLASNETLLDSLTSTHSTLTQGCYFSHLLFSHTAGKRGKQTKPAKHTWKSLSAIQTG